MESMEDMEELEKLREKKLAERDERIQNIISLIRKLCCVLLAIAVSLMFFYVRNEYKTYTDSKVVKADVINVSGTKNGMLDVKYRYNYDGDKYEESVKQSVDEIKTGDEKEIRIRKSIPEKIITTTITTVICYNIAFALLLFASLGTIVLLFGLAKKKAEEDSDIEI